MLVMVIDGVVEEIGRGSGRAHGVVESPQIRVCLLLTKLNDAGTRQEGLMSRVISPVRKKRRVLREAGGSGGSSIDRETLREVLSECGTDRAGRGGGRRWR
jgi:hypothetical protein